MNRTIKIAYHILSEKYIHIDDADNGLACNCICKKCKERLEAIQGKIRINHFRHHSNLNCSGSQESALHELGKQILIENQQISIPKYGIISYSDPIAEKQYESIRPDVFAKVDKQYIFFEIYVTHAVDAEKEKVFIKKKLNSIEIDLQGAEELKYSEIRRLVLDEVNNKRIIFWNKTEDITSIETITETEKETTNSAGDIIVEIIIGGILVIGTYLGLKKLFPNLINRTYQKKKYYKKSRNSRFK